MQTMPILYTTTNHLFQATLTEKKQTASLLLLEQKNTFLSQNKPNENLDTLINGSRIEHNLDRLL